jgi:hypothetical protein
MVAEKETAIISDAIKGLSNGVKKNRKMSQFVLTNNPKVLASYPTATWIDGDAYTVLLECRGMVHAFHVLLTHPLMGDIRLIRNPYRTVVVGEKKRDVDLLSLTWIEESIDLLRRGFKEDQRVEHQEDYQMIDFDLFQKAVQQGKP